MTEIRDGFAGTIGNTPLIRLRRASAQTGCEILGKAEFLNPGGSVKDRPALQMILDAEAKGLLKPGGVVVEGTAGNTGIGLALVANARGYRSVIVMPDTQSQEKKDYLRLNVANREAHILTTAPEIFRQTDGQVDGFVCAVGSGGTLAGVAMGLRRLKPSVRIALADPHGAALHSYYTTGNLKSEGSSITEGIGQGRITRNLEGLSVDHAFRISDTEALGIVFDLLTDEGLFVGASSGINVAGAIALARVMGPGHRIVTILCDGGARYASKLFNPEFLRARDLPVPAWLDRPRAVPVATPLMAG
jgi:cysteine synthase A